MQIKSYRVTATINGKEVTTDGHRGHSARQVFRRLRTRYPDIPLMRATLEPNDAVA